MALAGVSCCCCCSSSECHAHSQAAALLHNAAKPAYDELTYTHACCTVCYSSNAHSYCSQHIQSDADAVPAPPGTAAGAGAKAGRATPLQR
jgi:hypothetical protein